MYDEVLYEPKVLPAPPSGWGAGQGLTCHFCGRSFMRSAWMNSCMECASRVPETTLIPITEWTRMHNNWVDRTVDFLVGWAVVGYLFLLIIPPLIVFIVGITSLIVHWAMR